MRLARLRPGSMLVAVVLTLAAMPAAAVEWTEERLFRHVIERAGEAAAGPWREPAIDLPAAVSEMDYDRYRDIRFRPDRALWRDERRYEVQFFHTGFLFETPVRIHQLVDGELKEVAFDPDLFRYAGKAAGLGEKMPDDAGFAGFRLHYPVNRSGYKDEVAAFLGASYFRLVGPGQVYGQSARGLGIDTAGAGDEEFPAFRHFWLVPPGEDEAAMTILALLDGPSVTGAYRFELRVDDDRLAVEIDKHLFARTDIDGLGVAPLTSMFLHGDTSVRRADDFRPRVHDSDGLLMRTSADEWLWRALKNPRALRVTALRDEQPRGYGLVQRERDFDRYLDLEAEYHRRPSLWVEPLGGDWQAGGVELVEIPSDSETSDNIVAYWAPEEPFDAGERRRYRYRLVTFGETPPEHDLARVIRTRSGWDRVPGEPDPPPRSVRRFIVDYGVDGSARDIDPADLEADLDVSAGTVSDLHVRALPDGGAWRVSFRLEPDDGQPADMRLTLQRDGRQVAETWTCVWYPDEP